MDFAILEGFGESDDSISEVEELSTGIDDTDEEGSSLSTKEEKADDLQTVDEEDDERRIEVLRIFKKEVQAKKDLFDDSDVQAIEAEIKRMEKSKKRLWKKQCVDRLRVLSHYERVLKLSKNHPSLNKYFVGRHREMQKMIADL